MLWRSPAVRVLLLALALGVAGMHTLGHHEGHGGATAAANGHAAHAAEPVPPAKPGTVAATPPTGDLDPSQMCLAILTAGALLGLALAAVRLTQRVPADRRPPWSRTGAHASRGPPGPTATGPLLAGITVLRI